MSHCCVSSDWTQIVRIQFVDFPEWVSHQSDKIFQISLEERDKSLIFTQEIICLEQSSLNIWSWLNVNLIFKAECTTAQESTKVSCCHLRCYVLELQTSWWRWNLFPMQVQQATYLLHLPAAKASDKKILWTIFYINHIGKVQLKWESVIIMYFSTFKMTRKFSFTQ